MAEGRTEAHDDSLPVSAAQETGLRKNGGAPRPETSRPLERDPGGPASPPSRLRPIAYLPRLFQGE